MATAIRTDMADESHRLWQKANGAASLPGVTAGEQELLGLPVTAVEISDAESAAALGRPMGKFFTLLLPEHFSRGAEQFDACARACAELMWRCIPGRPDRVLVAALGNPDITPDALGSLAAGSVIVTWHLKQSDPESFRGFAALALCRPGVLGTTGVESARQIATLCAELKPELVIAVDALAGSEPGRLCRTVQISSAGIAPGSGVGNDRQELSQHSLGVPVISVGVPTVIDAGSLGHAGVDDMFVTPRSIDSVVRSAGRIIGYGIDLAVHRGITLGDIDMLVG